MITILNSLLLLLYRKYNTCFNNDVNKREYRRDNTKWTIQRNCQHIVHKNQEKHNKELCWLISFELTPLSAIFHGDQLQWWKNPESRIEPPTMGKQLRNVLDTSMRKQRQITKLRHETSYTELEVDEQNIVTQQRNIFDTTMRKQRQIT